MRAGGHPGPGCPALLCHINPGCPLVPKEALPGDGNKASQRASQGSKDNKLKTVAPTKEWERNIKQ